MANRAREARLAAQIRWPGATVVDRNRTAIYHRHPTLPRVSIDAVIGAMHTLAGDEIDTAWRPAVAPYNFEVTSADYLTRVKTQFNAADVVEWSRGGEYIRFIAGQLEYNNDRNDVQLISAAQAVTGAVDDERMSWLNAYGAGLDFTWINKSLRLVKLLTIQSLASLPAPSAQILGGANPVLRLQFQFSTSANVDIYVNGARWNRTGSRDTSGSVEFRNATTGESLWYFDPGAAWDTGTPEHDRVQITPVTRFRRTGPSLFFEVRVPWSYLQSASYPVYVDPTIDVSVNTSDDDAYENTSGNVVINATAFNVDATSEWAAYRFTGITITSYSSMVASYLTLYFATASTDEPDVRIYGEDVDTPAQYAAGTGTYSISGRTVTTASVVWSNTNLGAAGSFNTDSLNDIVAELVGSHAYSSGVMAFQYTSANGTGTRDCEADFYDSANADPALHIEYNQGGGTQYPQSVAGTVTPAGGLANQANKLLSGALVPAGALVKQAQKAFGGVLTSSGTLVKQAQKALAGELSSSGVVAGVKIALINLAGALGLEGLLSKQSNKATGGTIASSGALARSIGKSLSGALAPAGAVIKSVNKLLGGSIAPSGVAAGVKTALISLGGTLTSSGVLVLRTAKGLGGILASSGGLSRATSKMVSGSLTSAGVVSKRINKALSGILSLGGLLNAVLSGALTGLSVLYGKVRLFILHGRDRDMTLDGEARSFTLKGHDR